MNQLCMNFEAPSLSAARSMGAEGMRRAADHAESDEPGFIERARAFVLAYLDQHGVSSGELLTDACKVSGIRPVDDRAFGQVYKSLLRLNQIAYAGECPRHKGHGSRGGSLYRRVR